MFDLKIVTLSLIGLIFTPNSYSNNFVIKLDNNLNNSIQVVNPTEIIKPPTEEVVYPPIVMPDWVNTTDECGGIKQIDSGANIYFLRAKHNSQSINIDLEIPEGFRRTFSYEYANLTPDLQRSYFGRCGLSGYPKSITNEYQDSFYFADSKTTSYSQHSAEFGGVLRYGYNQTLFAGYVISRIEN